MEERRIPPDDPRRGRRSELDALGCVLRDHVLARGNGARTSGVTIRSRHHGVLRFEGRTPGSAAGRQTAGEITFFKSVGSAIEDLAAAIAVYGRGQS